MEIGPAHLTLSLIVRKLSQRVGKSVFASSQPHKLESLLFWQPTFYIQGSYLPYHSCAIAITFCEEPFGQFVAGMHPKRFAQLMPSGGLNLWVLLHLARLAQLEACCTHCPKTGYSHTGWQWVIWHWHGKAALVLALLGISGTPRNWECTTKPKKYWGRLNMSS